MSEHAETTSRSKGRCLCGAIEIDLTDPKPHIDVCHCTMCRQWGAGPFMGVSGASFALNGQDQVAVYCASQWAERAFCKTCGSSLYYRFLPTDHYSFSAGLFDLGQGFTIEKQIFVDEKPSFYDFAQETPMQTGAQVIAEAVAAGVTFPEEANES